jgi:hypothetical protein
VIGHSYVVGLWLSSYTLTGNACVPPTEPPRLTASEKIMAWMPHPELYLVPQAAGDAAYMFKRCRVWPPNAGPPPRGYVGGGRPYP